MEPQILGFALAAGMVAALNPCGFALLPAYLTLVIAGDRSRTRLATIGRALSATGLMSAGFLLVFGTFGLVVAPLASSVQRYLPAVTVVIGLAVMVLGVWLLTGHELNLPLPAPVRGSPTARLGSMVGYGIAYAIASLSCTIGPFLAVTSATFRTGSTLSGILAFLAYGAGMTLTVGVLAIAVALAGSAITSGFRRLLPAIGRIGGAILVLVGGYVAYYGAYELRLFFGDGDPGDSIVEAAGRVQQTLAGWLDVIGPIPLLVALAVLVLIGVLGLRRRRSLRSESPDERR